MILIRKALLETKINRIKVTTQMANNSKWKQVRCHKQNAIVITFTQCTGPSSPSSNREVMTLVLSFPTDWCCTFSSHPRCLDRLQPQATCVREEPYYARVGSRNMNLFSFLLHIYIYIYSKIHIMYIYNV